MNKSLKKTLTAAMCCTVIAGGVGAGVFAVTSEEPQEKTEEKTAAVSVGSASADEKNNSDFEKDETVYVLSGADGKVEKIIVSDWIKNEVRKGSFYDSAELTDVENVKGDETYSMNGDNMRVWDTQGNDIYFQGNIEKELPVDISVTYKLDGKNISSEELAGKSGKVTIRFDYTNKLYETVEIDGKREKMNVPFAMMTGMVLDNDIFSNVEVSNGKIFSDGNHTIIAGIAFPGLQTNLNLDPDKMEIPDYVEITADAEGFEMANTVTVATNEIFSNINADTDEMDSIDDLNDALGEMTEAMDQLIDGSSELYDGLCTLLDKSNELISGIDRLEDGASKLTDGIRDLNGGASELANGTAELSDGASSILNGAEELVSGAKTLSGGLEALAENNDTLNAGARQVFESLLNTAEDQLKAAGVSVPKLTVENYAQTLNETIDSLDPDGIAKQAREAARKSVAEKVNAQKNDIAASVEAAIRADSANKQMQPDEIKAMAAAETEKQISLMIEQNMNSPEVQSQITDALKQKNSGAVVISSLKENIDSYNQFYIGFSQYTAGVASVKDGADKLYAGAENLRSGAEEINGGSVQLNNGAADLKNGTEEAYAGMNELYDGIVTLKDGAPALIDGITQLRDGSMQLTDGLKEFNEEGIQKLADAADGDLKGLTTRFKSTVDVSKNFKSFSGISNGMDGQVKFIYRTDAIEIN